MSEQKIKILLAEDDPNLGVLLVDLLQANGIGVVLCKDGHSALQTFHKSRFDLCLLDIMLPKLDGFSLATEIRRSNKVIPIIYLTAKTLKEDKLTGYGIGADDYITKPFDEEELIWKIKAVIRRISHNHKEENQEIISIGKYRFDYKNQSLKTGDTSIRLTEKENDILNYLYLNKNKLIKRESVLKDLWGENDYFLGRSLDVFITKIRKHLKDDPTISIENIFGVGFVFNVPEK